MMKLFNLFFKKDNEIPNKQSDLVDTIKNYQKTYDLLGRYDTEHIKDPAELAEPGRMREAILRFQAQFR